MASIGHHSPEPVGSAAAMTPFFWLFLFWGFIIDPIFFIFAFACWMIDDSSSEKRY